LEYSVEELVQKSKEGDERSILELISMYKKLVMNVIYKITNDYHTSQDLCQETFLKAFLNLKKLKKKVVLRVGYAKLL